MPPTGREGTGREAALTALAGCALLEDLDPDALVRLAEAARLLELTRDEAAFQQGESAKGSYVVERGRLKASKIAASGREQVLHYFAAGDMVNEVGLFLEIANPAALIALEDSRVWFVPRHALRALVDERPQLLWPLTHGLALRLHRVVSMMQELTMLPLEARVAKFLLEHAEHGRFERPAWATQAELAARLGTVADVLQRTLAAFADERLITVERRRITILDRAGLEAKVRQD